MPTAAQIWRNYNTDGVPGSGDKKPVKSEIRAWGTDIETRLDGLDAVNSTAVPIQKFGGGSGMLASTNEAAMTAALASGEPQILLPHLDATPYEFGDAEFVLSAGVSVRGDNQTPVRSAAADALFKVQGYDRRCTVADMRIDMNTSATPGSAGVRLDNYLPLYPFGGDFGAGLTLWGPRIERMRFVNCYRAIADSDHGAARENTFTATAAQTVFNINYTPTSNSRISVIINGVVKTVTTDYTYFGTVVTYVGTPLAGGETVVITDPFDYRGLVTDVIMRDINTRRARGTQILLRRTQGSILLDDVFIDPQQDTEYATAIPTIGWPGIDIANIVGLRMNRVDVVGDGFDPSATYDGNANGCRITGADRTTPFSGISGKYALYVANSTFEACKGSGLIIDNLDSVSLLEVSGRGNRGYGLYAEDCSRLHMSSVRMLGAIGVPGAQTVGVIAVVRGDEVLMTNCKAGEGAAMGLVVVDTPASLGVLGLIASDNATYPIVESGTSASNSYDGVRASGNGTSNAPQIAATSVLGDGSNIGGVPMILKGSTVYDIPNLPPGGRDVFPITVTGAALGDYVIGLSCNAPIIGSVYAALLLDAEVTAANTVTVLAYNAGAADFDAVNATYRVEVRRRLN